MDELREADVIHRQAYQQFVLLEARPWYQQHLGRLYLLWGKWNQDYFGATLVTPYVLFAEPSSPQRLPLLNNPLARRLERTQGVTYGRFRRIRR